MSEEPTGAEKREIRKWAAKGDAEIAKLSKDPLTSQTTFIACYAAGWHRLSAIENLMAACGWHRRTAEHFVDEEIEKTAIGLD